MTDGAERNSGCQWEQWGSGGGEEQWMSVGAVGAAEAERNSGCQWEQWGQCRRRGTVDVSRSSGGSGSGENSAWMSVEAGGRRGGGEEQWEVVRGQRGTVGVSVE